MAKKLDAKKRKIIVVPITREMHDEIRKLCFKKGLSINNFVQNAISDYLKSINDKDAADKILREVEQALEKSSRIKLVGSFIEQKTRSKK